MTALLRLTAGTALAIALSPAIVARQTARDAPSRQPTGPGSIAGRVVAADGPSAPIRRVQITLVNSDRTVGRTVVSDDAGRFVFTNLPAGRFSIEARKAAYLTAALGARRPGGSGAPVMLADGQHVTDRVIAMSRGAVVTGAVHHETGGPAVGVSVAVLYPAMRGESEVLNSPPTSAIATTDDTGVYRIYGLPPGEVVVIVTTGERININGRSDGLFQEIGPGDVTLATRLAKHGATSAPNPADFAFLSTPNPGPFVTFAPVFHRGSTDLGAATRLTLAAGEERTGIDIALRLVRTAMVRGVVTGPDGLPVANAQVRLSGGVEFGTPGGSVSGTGQVGTGPDGRFQIGFMTPGQYVVVAVSATRALGAPPTTNQPPAPIVLWAMQDVTIAGRDLDVALQLQPNMFATGRVVVDSASANPNLTGVEMRLVPVGTRMFLGEAASISAGDRTFRMPLLPGRYRLSISQPPASRWVPVSSMLRGQDTLDVAYDVRAGDAISDWVVTITDRPSELAGTITDASGQPAADYFIVVFAADRAFWTRPSRRVVHTRSTGDGTYLFRGLPAGQYRIAALTDLEFSDSIPASFLESLVASSLPVSIADRQRTTQNLRIGSR
jgi:hypothetical protein